LIAAVAPPELENVINACRRLVPLVVQNWISRLEWERINDSYRELLAPGAARPSRPERSTVAIASDSSCPTGDLYGLYKSS